MHKRIGIVAGMCLALAAALLAQSPATPSPELQKLEVSLGRWVFHGTAKNARTGKVTEWTWNEDCGWSPNHLFLQCAFDNVWAGRPVRSLVVDTYNSTDHAYWHFEMYAAGETGAHPFVSKMDVQGDTWIEYGASTAGKPPTERIVYNWGPAGKVKVAIERSTDGATWTTVDEGTGTRLP